MTTNCHLSVLISTYNHEKFIAEALESVLAQKTQTTIEIIVCDDCSTDKTREIVSHYLQKSDNICLLPPEKNRGITKNLKRGLEACSGKYIAILEGDDYWISPYKLQKQMDYLDQHLECSFCFNGLLILNQQHVFQEHSALTKLKSQNTFAIEDLIQDNFIGNFSTCMYRQDIIKKLPSQLYDVFTVDWMFNMACAQFGCIGCLPLQMTAYRKHDLGVWSSQTTQTQYQQIINLIPVYDQLLNYQYTKHFSKLKNHYQDCLNPSYKNIIKAGIKDWTPPILMRAIKKLIKIF